MRIAVGGDNTYHVTGEVCDYLESKGHELVRCGALAGKAADYVDAAREVAEKVASGECEQGLLFCFTGTGVTIVANKIPGVRAALCIDEFAARIARLANNANVIVLSVRLTTEHHAKQILDMWLATDPSEEARRMNFHRKTDEVDAEFRKS